MKQYRIILPTPETAKAMGIRYEGLRQRTQFWLMGVSSGVNFSLGNDTSFNVYPNSAGFIIETNAESIIPKVIDYLREHGWSD